jgi:transposase
LPVGRPTKLDPERKKKLFNAIAAGNFIQPACDYAGVSYFTVRKWVQRGEREGKGIYWQFAQELKEAQARAEVSLTATIKNATVDNWQAAGWLLSRRFPDRWSESSRVRLEVEKQLQSTLDALESQLPPELFAQVLVAMSAEHDGEAGPEATGEP